MKAIKTVLLLISMFLLLFSCGKKETEKASSLQKLYLEGFIQGTSYHITYLHKNGTDYHPEIKAELTRIDKSLSIYDSLSIISRINRNDSTVEIDSIFATVFREAQQIAKQTNGAFDITVGPLMKLWGFNKAQKTTVTPTMIDSIQASIGYQKIKLAGNKLLKENSAISLDANAIAQGYSCDRIAALLESKGIQRYMIEIGGEISCKGFSPRGDAWKLGINEPIEDSTGTTNKIREIICVKDMAVSTSGNYRKYYYQNGKKYGHEIDPRTGYPTSHKLLSVTVIAPKCSTADAYATAFMVMGVVQSIHLLQKLPGIEAYFIYEDSNGKTKDIYTRGFWKYLEKNNLSS